jgi:hypothetical protein
MTLILQAVTAKIKFYSYTKEHQKKEHFCCVCLFRGNHFPPLIDEVTQVVRFHPILHYASINILCIILMIAIAVHLLFAIRRAVS